MPLNNQITNGDAATPALFNDRFTPVYVAGDGTYGVKGDGVTNDQPALQALADLVPSGSVISLLPGATYLLEDDEDGNAYVTFSNKNIVIEGNGATIKMGAGTGYVGLRVHAATTGVIDYAIFRNIIFDGNKANQNWPGGPNGQGWEVDIGNHGGLSAHRVNFVVFDGCVIKNNVSDGIVTNVCETAVITNCLGKDAAPLDFSESGRQNNYFKARGNDHGRLFVSNCETRDGSIGIHFSSAGAAGGQVLADDTMLMVSNCYVYNPAQNGIKSEQAKTVIVRGCVLDADDSTYIADIPIGNECEFAFISDTHVRHGRIDFANATNLVFGGVHDVRVEADSTDEGIANCTHASLCRVSNVSGGGILFKSGAGSGYGSNLYITQWSGNGITRARFLSDVELDNAAGGSSGTGIRCNSDTLRLRGFKVSSCSTGISVDNASARAIISDGEVKNTSRNSIGMIQADIFVVRAVICENFGSDTTVSNSQRAAIGGPNTGAVATLSAIEGCYFLKTGGGTYYDRSYDEGGFTAPALTRYINNYEGANVTRTPSFSATTVISHGNYPLDENSGTAFIANGGSVTHGLRNTPSAVFIEPTVAKRIHAVIATSNTTFGVALHDDTGAAIASAETVYWRARVNGATRP